MPKIITYYTKKDNKKQEDRFNELFSSDYLTYLYKCQEYHLVPFGRCEFDIIKKHPEILSEARRSVLTTYN